MKAVGAFSVKSYNQQRRDARQMIIKAARELQMMVVPEGGSLLYMNETHVLDGHTAVEHTLPVPRLYKDIVQLFAQERGRLHADAHRRLRRAVGRVLLVSARRTCGRTSGCCSSRRATWSTRDRAGGTMAPDDDFNHVLHREGRQADARCRRLVQLGAHGQLQGLGAHWEMWMLQQGGMTPMEALRAATIDGARYSASTRTSARSRRASWPTSSCSTAIRSRTSATPSRSMVMLNGRLYDGKTLAADRPQ